MTAVSVVMPVRNEERSVAGAITSVLSQSEADLELLVVDGDSTDATLREVERIAAVEPRVRILHNPQRTIPHALNLGLAAARGRYLARVDAHAAVNDTYLERGVTTLDADPAVAAVGGRRIGVAASASGVAAATALSSKFGVGDSINHYALTAQDTDHASFGVFRVDVLRAVGGWDVNLPVNEDVDIDHRIMAAGHRIRFDPQMCIYWHVRESLPALGRQYRRYGRGKAAMVRKNGRSAVRVRHLAPPALVVGLAGAAVATAAGFWPVGLLLAGPYALAVAGATAATLRSGDPVPHPDGVAEARHDRAGLEQPAPDLVSTDLRDADRVTSDLRGADRWVAERQVAERQVAERVTSDLHGVGRLTPLAGLARPDAGTPTAGDGVTRSAAARPGDVRDSVISVETGASAPSSAGARRPDPLRLAAAFVAMHLGWGLGFLEGSLFRLAPAASSARQPRTR